MKILNNRGAVVGTLDEKLVLQTDNVALRKLWDELKSKGIPVLSVGKSEEHRLVDKASMVPLEPWAFDALVGALEDNLFTVSD